MMVRQYTTFSIGDGLYGIDVLLVSEINRNLDITEVSPAPDFVRGLINLRGQIVTVIDPGVRFGIGRRTMTKDSCCIVLKSTAEAAGRPVAEESKRDSTNRDTVAILADRIGDMVDVNEEDIERAPANVHGVDAQYLAGVVKLEHDLLVCIRVSKLVSVSDFS
jgi:purine-binding chemotaxis protein CheW